MLRRHDGGWWDSKVVFIYAVVVSCMCCTVVAAVVDGKRSGVTVDVELPVSGGEDREVQKGLRQRGVEMKEDAGCHYG